MIEINRHPSRKDLRVFAIGLTILLSLAGWWLRRRWQLDFALPVGLTLGTLVALVGVARPDWLRRVYVGWMLAFAPVNWLVSLTLLGIVYYLVLTPIAWGIRLRGRDPLDRSYDRQATTYWKTRTRQPEPESYFRTF